MNKQYMEEVRKSKKVFLTSVGDITMWLYHSLLGSEKISRLFKEQGRKEIENGFILCYYITLRYIANL